MKITYSADWEPRTQPALRTALQGKIKITWPCPYCGQKSLIRSDGDLTKDDVRIEVYCNNTDCCAREIHIIAQTRGEAGRRADLEALEVVDHGPTQGEFCMWSLGRLMEECGHERDRTLQRRRGHPIPCCCDICSKAREGSVK